jgi:hypothetical protein
MFTTAEIGSHKNVEQNLLRNLATALLNTNWNENVIFLFFRLGVHRRGCRGVSGQHGCHLEVRPHRRYDFTGIEKLY